MNHVMKRVAIGIALAGAFGAAQATSLANNAPTSSVDVTASFFGGTLLDSALSSVATPSYTGFARTAVYDTGSGLDFYYQFTNDATSLSGVERFTAYDFSGLGSGPINVFQTAAAFGIFSAGTENSDGADRTAAGVVGFNFVPNLNSKIVPGTTSFTQIIRTDARSYVAGNLGILNGFGSNATAFAPSPIPEPESVAMLLAGLGLMGTIARRRIRGRSA